jgi:hypothetical protein
MNINMKNSLNLNLKNNPSSIKTMDIWKLLEDIYNLSAEKFHLNNCWVCMYVAEFAAKCLLEQWITNFKVIEGYVITKESRRQEDNWIDIRHQHTWVELTDWTKIDPSVVQFDEFDWIEVIDWKENRSVKSIYTPEERLKVMIEEEIDYSDKRFIK